MICCPQCGRNQATTDDKHLFMGGVEFITRVAFLCPSCTTPNYWRPKDRKDIAVSFAESVEKRIQVTVEDQL